MVAGPCVLRRQYSRSRANELAIDRASFLAAPFIACPTVAAR